MRTVYYCPKCEKTDVEVVVIEEHFGVRLISLISPKERIRSLAGDA